MHLQILGIFTYYHFSKCPSLYKLDNLSTNRYQSNFLKILQNLQENKKKLSTPPVKRDNSMVVASVLLVVSFLIVSFNVILKIVLAFVLFVFLLLLLLIVFL